MAEMQRYWLMMVAIRQTSMLVTMGRVAFAPLFHSISSLKNLPPGLPFQALAILLSGQYQ